MRRLLTFMQSSPRSDSRAASILVSAGLRGDPAGFLAIPVRRS